MAGVKELNIVIGGEAGQGVQTMGRLLSEALAASGYSILVSQTYHSRIRGGHNTYAIRCGRNPPPAPKRHIDLLVALNEETVELHRGELSENGMIIFEYGAGAAGSGAIAVPFTNLASKKMKNTVALGVTCGLIGLEGDLVASLLRKGFAKKDEALQEENDSALKEGYRWIDKNRPAKAPSLVTLKKKKERLLITGNDAIALGALSAGLRFCSFYPMTPSTSIILAIIKAADKMGVVCEQAEDEIAAVNMAIGASFAGAPSLVATSGGGFALMNEGVSLAAMTETPLFVIVAQRPGPATGLPTRTEQGDLEFVLHAGHGEFPRAILAPTTVVECFSLAQKAMHLAEKSQGPVFLLTDQYLADSLQDIDRKKLPDPDPVEAGDPLPEGESEYVRYRFTENGRSPRLLPGRSERLVAADSDEHDQEGHITEDLSLRTKMVDKRLAKLRRLEKEISQPVYQGDDSPALLFVSWGSSRGAVQEAADILKNKGRSVATLSFCQVWPLEAEHFLDRLKSADRVVVVEGNATGQFARLLHSETGFNAHAYIGRYDGLTLDADYILEKLSDPADNS
jgi:2-oxoglutarate ferredoxin oxidoreductase subunit alpha